VAFQASPGPTGRSSGSLADAPSRLLKKLADLVNMTVRASSFIHAADRQDDELIEFLTRRKPFSALSGGHFHGEFL
jgi:hypothetical protein